MEINSITGQEQQTAATQADNTLAKDFDNFLVLLTTQLQYQDPLAPMDSNQFTQQLVSFTGVEQSIATNKNLEDIIAQNKTLAKGNAVDYLGKEITIGTNRAGLTDDGTATWEYLLEASTNSTKLIIKDENGFEVDTTGGDLSAGIHTFVWTAPEGTDPGTYSLEIEALAGNEETVGHNVYSIGVVKSIENVGGEILLSSNGILTSPGNVLAVKEVIKETTPAENGTE